MELRWVGYWGAYLVSKMAEHLELLAVEEMAAAVAALKVGSMVEMTESFALAA